MIRKKNAFLKEKVKYSNVKSNVFTVIFYFNSMMYSYV